MGYFDIGHVTDLGEASHLDKLVKVEEREFSQYTEKLSGKLLFIYFSFSSFIILSLSQRMINLSGEAVFFPDSTFSEEIMNTFISKHN